MTAPIFEALKAAGKDRAETPTSQPVVLPADVVEAVKGSAMSAQHTPNPWEQGLCCVPMWMGGVPAGFCGNVSYGHRLPRQYLSEVLGRGDVPYCHGHACVAHGGPREDEPRIFSDGLTEEGRPMWCAVMPDFINLHESPAGFDGNPMKAVANLRAAIAKGGAA